ncbi:MAG: OmpA family protein [Prevotellaceae bacterium]|jgi:peptidoglycan-associated lipoprotein|nr:OmpA family protein [Prevotellaceae bacterium]
MKIKLSFSVFLCFILLLSLSSCGVKAGLAKGNKRFELGEYNAAAASYRRVYAKIKNNANKAQAAYRMGFSYQKTGVPTRAMQAYSNAIRLNYPNDTVYILYANVLRQNGRFSEAITYYERYLDLHPDSYIARNGIESCEQINDWKALPQKYDVRATTFVTSRRTTEFSPLYGDKEGSMIYFTSSRDNRNTGGKASRITGARKTDIFFVKKDTKPKTKGKWTKPEAIEGEINTIYDEGAATFAPDGRTMYFTRARMEDGLAKNVEAFRTNRAGEQWSTPQRLAVFADSTMMVAHPTVSPDGKYLYFVSDREGGIGGKDIWRAEILGDSFGAIQNLGREINTAGDEVFPSFRDNGDLYFASNGWAGFGGLDIFKASLEDRHWRVENLMSPINSSSDDFGITFLPDSENGLFSSNRNNPKGFDKLWEFIFSDNQYVLQGRVTDANTGEPLMDASIKIVSDQGMNEKIQVERDGSFRVIVSRDANFVLLATNRGYLNKSGKFDSFSTEKRKTFTVDFAMATVTRPVEIQNIFYAFGKWDLNIDAKASLMELVETLNANPTITVEIGSHTDAVGSDQVNLELSEKRAQTVVDFLVEQGIAPDRLKARGYGQREPVKADAHLAQQYNFIAEGDVLDETFTARLNREQHEIVNQINRRTEFRVLRTY